MRKLRSEAKQRGGSWEEEAVKEGGRMKPGLVFLPVPGRGHLASTVEFAKIINQNNRFSITILKMGSPVPGVHLLPTSTYESIASSGIDIDFVDLPPVEMPDETSPEAFVSVFIGRHAPHVKDSILRLRSSSSSVRVVALVVDLFATAMVEVGEELGIPTYLFFTSGAALLALMLYLPTLDEKIESDFEDMEGNVDVPGLGALTPLIMPTPVMKKKTQAYWWFVEHGRKFRYMRGIITNTFRELEPGTLEAIEDGRCLPDHPTPPVFPVGPVLVLEEEDLSHPCISWLDNQPPGSVVFLCFGSLGALPEPQLKEIALGLERSGHRFLWSFRSRRSPGFTPLVDANPDEVLPEGFMERTKERGLVWPRWAPQTAVLSHAAVGGFVSHCGWNSTLESLWFGVPILAWPLAAEQRLNGFLLANDIGAGVEVDYRAAAAAAGAAAVGAAEVERGVRSLMGETEEGKRARDRALEAKRASRAAVKAGGSSFDALTRVADHFLSHL